ncbi:MAG: sugar nucleotide-binding protein [Arachidicoccus sp.]|nr:sugar nucleotide-binding protein [Arachidicoccus sp.]
MHFVNDGEATWHELATAIFEGAEARGRTPVRVNPITTADYPTPAKRPANSCLNGDKLDDTFGLRLDPWRMSLDDCLDRLVGPQTEDHSG